MPTLTSPCVIGPRTGVRKNVMSLKLRFGVAARMRSCAYNFVTNASLVAQCGPFETTMWRKTRNMVIGRSQGTRVLATSSQSCCGKMRHHDYKMIGYEPLGGGESKHKHTHKWVCYLLLLSIDRTNVSCSCLRIPQLPISSRPSHSFPYRSALDFA